MSSARIVSLGVRLYRLALNAYPSRFRAGYADDMAATFRRQWTAVLTRSTPGAAALWYATALADVLRSLLLQRTAERRRRSRLHIDVGRGDHMIRTLWQDVRIGTRTLCRRPGLSASIVLTLAIGTGATTAIFSILDAGVLRPLPYPRANEIASILQSSDRFGDMPLPPPYLDELRARLRNVESIAGFSASWPMVLTGSGEPGGIFGAYVSDGLLRMLGARPVAGRDFLPEEHRGSGARVTLVRADWWEQHYGPIGAFSERVVHLDGDAYTIVGVLPADLRMPLKSSVVVQHPEAAELWVPFVMNGFWKDRTVPVMNVISRLKPGVTLDQARAELRTVAAAMAKDLPAGVAPPNLDARPLVDVVSRGVRTPLLLLFAAVVALLVIACANVGNLLLAHASSRQRELAVRSSLGATRGRLMQQLLTESVLLAVAGSAGGFVLAWWALKVTPAVALQNLPSSAVVQLDARMAAFALAAAVVTAVLFGLAPAMATSRSGPGTLLKDGARTAGDRAGRHLRNGLVVAEMALALVLLVGAGLLARSFWSLVHVDPGFATQGLIAVPIDMSVTGYEEASRRRATLDAILAKLAVIPGVERIGVVNRLPLSGSNTLVGIEIEGQPDPSGRTSAIDRRVVTEDYFRAMGLRVVDGREFSAVDQPDGQGVAVVNETMARRSWPAGRATGARLRLRLRSGPGPWLSVVGVVGDLRHHGLDQPPAPEVYVPYAQAPVETLFAVVRTARDAGAIVPAIKSQIWSVDRNMALDRIATLDETLGNAIAAPRFRMLLVNGFALIALLLATIGIYGVVSYSVTRRTREFGVRLAVGAQRQDIVGMVVREGLMLSAGGAAAGVVGALLLTRLLRGFLFGVSPTDPTTFAGVVVLLTAVAALASYLPARRATRIDPVEALRTE